MANTTLEQEMETDDDHATMRESFLLVQNILFIGFTNIHPAHQQEIRVEKLWKAMQFGLDSGENSWCPCEFSNCLPGCFQKLQKIESLSISVYPERGCGCFINEGKGSSWPKPDQQIQAPACFICNPAVETRRYICRFFQNQ